MTALAAGDADEAVLAQWWREVLATGDLPAAVQRVQGRLLRQVGRAELPSGPVFLKVMAFPRPRDRLRYLCRALPGAHEAAMLRRLAAAGVRCPEVVAVRTARRGLLPFRSLLVTRALPVAGAPPDLDAEAVFAARAGLAARLLAAGFWHRDLNPDNFVWLEGGGLAVLDLQSMRRSRRRAAAELQTAGRLLLESELAPGRAHALLRTAGFGTVDAGAVEREATAQGLAFLRSRLRRCLSTSTGFERRRRGCRIEYRRRGDLPDGTWVDGGRELFRAWLGQRALQMFERRIPILHAWRRNMLWLPGKQSAYISRAVVDRQRQALGTLLEGFARFEWVWQVRPGVGFEEVRCARARYLAEGGG